MRDPVRRAHLVASRHHGPLIGPRVIGKLKSERHETHDDGEPDQPQTQQGTAAPGQSGSALPIHQHVHQRGGEEERERHTSRVFISPAAPGSRDAQATRSSVR